MLPIEAALLAQHLLDFGEQGSADQRHGRLTVIARCEQTIQSLLGFGRIARAQLVLNHPADFAPQGGLAETPSVAHLFFRFFRRLCWAILRRTASACVA